MLLGARILDNVASVNSYDEVLVAEFTEGDAPSIYIQLVDLSKRRAIQRNLGGLRYMPAAGSVLSVLIDNIDDAKKLTKVATQPFAQDPSIWKIVFGATDQVRGTCSLRLTLTEPGPAVTRGNVDRALRVFPQAKV